MKGELRFKADGSNIKFSADLQEATNTDMLLLARILQTTSVDILTSVLNKMGKTVVSGAEAATVEEKRILAPP